MKAFFFSEQMIETLTNKLRRDLRDEYWWRQADEQIAKHIVEEIKANPIELNETSVSQLKSPCRFVPFDDIIGFVKSDDNILRGVFVKV